MRVVRRINWLPVLVMVLVIAGLVLTVLEKPYGIAVIIAAVPVSILEVARLLSSRVPR